ncbi:hypothetical protein M0802_000709 [Mischocyttarus mexicanus]|nr:hypothetical protein M0802_000709 [Mischocyttarus mexicanus]
MLVHKFETNMSPFTPIIDREKNKKEGQIILQVVTLMVPLLRSDMKNGTYLTKEEYEEEEEEEEERQENLVGLGQELVPRELVIVITILLLCFTKNAIYSA